MGIASFHLGSTHALPTSDRSGDSLPSEFGQSLDWFKDKCIYGYVSIPINTIFRGMNIHKSQLF